MEEDDPETDDTQNETTFPPISLIVCSPDGQWLTTSDLRGRTHVFNLDSLQVRSSLHSVGLVKL